MSIIKFKQINLIIDKSGKAWVRWEGERERKAWGEKHAQHTREWEKENEKKFKKI